MNIKQSVFWRLATAYFKQPIFDPEKPICLNPFTFRRNEQIQFLERCYQLNYEAEVF